MMGPPSRKDGPIITVATTLPGTEPGESRLKIDRNGVAKFSRQERYRHAVCVAGR